ncbi:hypothetical protein WICMUC_000632 [Wickerhamomyces mucosus]|uniref:AP-3 complex subunit delta n=1 Tax=Wickerhamomyces mucosus TaxID=1378264 RepID=A0A9P8PZ36_9ASCO|nr:hypothetical protein WICMUC_000632 [Wickerhamomyces mucosus]
MSQKNNDVRARLKPFGIFFEKSLTDLIKGIRSNKEPEAQAKFLQDAIQECRKEVKSADLDIKTMAVLKLAYLEMYGFDMTWANFNVLEVMSSSKFQQKRVGYLSSNQSFRNDNDVLMLTTNLLKKDLNSSKPVEVGVALSGISNIVTTPLASDVSDDIIKMLNHSKPYIRKKAVLAMYKVFLKYPDALRTNLNRIIDKLDDDDESVVTATVTVICELSKKTPKILINLAPRLYDLLNTSSNNWMLIRLLKLFSSLATIEPRLKGKLLAPVLELMAKTKASSLVFECCNCLVSGDMISEDDYEVASLCLEELVEFFKNNDSNLKFVGLLAFYKIGKINPKFINSYAEYILKFIEDPDLTIREKALELIDGIIDEENLFEIVKQLMIQLIPEENSTILSDQYKLNIIRKILKISSNDNYKNIPSFPWYLSVLNDLLDLSIINNLDNQIVGDLIGNQFLDITIRVPSIRKDIIKIGIKILNDAKYYNKSPNILQNIIWITGEYSNFIKNGDDLIESILNFKKTLFNLSNPKILIIYIQSIIKIYNNFINKDLEYWDTFKREEILKLTNSIINFLNELNVNKNFEIQERSIEFQEFLKLIVDSIEEHDPNAVEPPLLITKALPSLFDSWEITPLSPGTQLKISKPIGLDLDTPINQEFWDDIIEELSKEDNYDDEEFEECLYEDHGYTHDEINDDDDDDDDDDDYNNNDKEKNGGEYEWNNDEEISNDRNKERKRERFAKIKDDPYYLSNDSTSNSLIKKSNNIEDLSNQSRPETPTIEIEEPKNLKKIKPKKETVLILSNETIIADNSNLNHENLSRFKPISSSSFPTSSRKNVLKIDSSNLDNFELQINDKEEEIGIKELNKLREKLQSSSITETNSLEQDENVVVIRKKKKKSGDKVKKLDENGVPIKKKKKKSSNIEDVKK